MEKRFLEKNDNSNAASSEVGTILPEKFTKKQFVKNIKAGLNISSIFLLIKKQIKRKKSGENYWIITLQDKSGSIDGFIWSDVCNELSILRENNLNEGDFVLINAEASEYNGLIQLKINYIEKVRKEDEKYISIRDFIRTSAFDTNLMLSQLKNYIKKVENKYLKRLLEVFFKDDEFVKEFCLSSAAVQYHHAYIGGLLEHTLSTTKLCDFIAENYKYMNSIKKGFTNINDFKDLVLTGAILHDMGKIHEYKSEKNGAFFKITDEGKLLGHITIGYGMVLTEINLIKRFPAQLKDRLLHIILSHHGHKEYGSPKRPKTLEAFIVYHADHLDADIGGFNFILENKAENIDWSEYLKNFDRSIFLKELSFDFSEDYREADAEGKIKINNASDDENNFPKLFK